MTYEKLVMTILLGLTMLCGIAWSLLMKPYLGIITFLLLGLTGFAPIFTDDG